MAKLSITMTMECGYDTIAHVEIGESIPSTPSNVEALGGADWAVIRHTLESMIADAQVRMVTQMLSVSDYQDVRKAAARDSDLGPQA